EPGVLRMLIRRASPRAPAKVSVSWKRLERWLSAHFPPDLQSLRSGATEAELDHFERVINQKLPPDVRESWAIHNGEEDPLGGVLFRGWLAPLERAEASWRNWQVSCPTKKTSRHTGASFRPHDGDAVASRHAARTFGGPCLPSVRWKRFPQEHEG